MIKNLLHKEATASIIARAQKLNVSSAARWGHMNATEMLLHSNRCNEEIFQEIQPNKRTTVKQFLLRILALYLAPHFKKGVKGDKRKDTVGEISPLHFEEEKTRFISLIEQFAEHKGRFTAPHIAFGNISTHEWGIAAYKHMDHHLRQFGV